ncbi:SIMPL domain-containing protein [Natronococcus pandeyae]|uniref:SIMPL domain-containing protein n=1 Tax=Natronococcus pandeyae TaxID=2055836 RepID=A0A8J8Q7R5_9EURY|nr:SIMPL domain-containing protein [Natronococcus pandeyae]TYL40218.1 SIMPL domain-containing protein [Natronococcus pandeyae]
MNRRQFLAGSGIAAVTTTAGCLTSAFGSDDPGSATQTTDAGDDNEIVVSTTGEATAEPDAASLSVGVEASGDTAEAVTDELAAQADALREAFDELEIPDENVEEGRYRVHPRRGRDGETDGYEGRHSFQLTIDDVDRIGEIIDELTAAGADDVGRVTFSLQEETRDEIRDEALDDALANADDEAQHIADNRGVTITGTKSVETGDVRLDTVYHETDDVAADDAADGPPTEIDADPVSVTASVTVAYGFE